MSSDPVAYTEEEIQALQTIQLYLNGIRSAESLAETALNSFPDNVALTVEEIASVKELNAALNRIRKIEMDLLSQELNIKANPWRRKLCEEVAKRENAGTKWK